MPLFTIRIEQLHVHTQDDAKLDAILAKLETIMAQFADIQDLIPALNDATNALATRVQLLIDRLQSSPTQEQIDAAVSDLTTLKSQLEGIGADPDNPLPG